MFLPAGGKTAPRTPDMPGGLGSRGHRKVRALATGRENPVIMHLSAADSRQSAPGQARCLNRGLELRRLPLLL